MQIRSVGIHLGKTTFHLVALGASSKVLMKKKFSQKQLLAFTANLNALEARAPRNMLVVAMANKLARVAWAVLNSGEDYRPGVIAAAA